MNLQGKTIIIVGATGGLGKVLCQNFYEVGANVSMGARSLDNLLTLKESLDPSKERTLVVPTDAVKRSDVEHLFAATQTEFGRVDAVVISVGKWEKSDINLSPAESDAVAGRIWQSIFEPARIVSDVAQRFFRDQKSGLIAHISSHAANRFLDGNLAYGPAKAAATRLMLNLRGELAGTGVRVSDLQPMIVKTAETLPLIKGAGFQPEDAVQPEDIAKYLIHNLDNRDIPAERPFECRIIL